MNYNWILICHLTVPRQWRNSNSRQQKFSRLELWLTLTFVATQIETPVGHKQIVPGYWKDPRQDLPDLAKDVDDLMWVSKVWEQQTAFRSTFLGSESLSFAKFQTAMKTIWNHVITCKKHILTFVFLFNPDWIKRRKLRMCFLQVITWFYNVFY